MFDIWIILRVIYSILFTVCNVYIIQFITALEAKKKCSLSKGWRITNGKIIASLLMIVGLINIFIPASKFLSTIPIIGSGYVLIFVIALFMIMLIVNRLAININESTSSNCEIKGYDMLISFFSEKTISECIYFTIIITVIFFYL